MAKAIFAGTPEFRYHAQVRHLQAPAGAISLSVYTTWAGSRNPEAPRQVLQVTTDAQGLRALAGMLLRNVADVPGADMQEVR